MVNNPLIRPYFLAGYHWGGLPLVLHDIWPFFLSGILSIYQKMMLYFQEVWDTQTLWGKAFLLKVSVWVFVDHGQLPCKKKLSFFLECSRLFFFKIHLVQVPPMFFGNFLHNPGNSGTNVTSPLDFPWERSGSENSLGVVLWGF